MRFRELLTTLALAACLLTAPAAARGASVDTLAGSVVGFVSDQAGVPQMGAAVLIYNSYQRLVGRALTNDQGAFGFESLAPGVYSVSVRLTSFVPALKENIRVQPGMRSFLAINLASVLSSIELIHTAPGNAAFMNDDWKWVLRTATAARPILRLGPSIAGSDPFGQNRESARVVSRTRGILRVSAGEEGSFMAAGAQPDLGTSFALATSLLGGNELQFSGNVGYASHSGLPTAGFRTSFTNDLWGARPEVAVTLREVFMEGRVGAGLLSGGQAESPVLRTMSVSSLDRRQLTERLRIEYGASLESVTFLSRLNYFSPFARLTLGVGEGGAVSLAYSSGMPPVELLSEGDWDVPEMQDDLKALALFPRVSVMGGNARIQRSQNFEAAYRQVIGSRDFSFGVYRETTMNSAVMMAAPAGVFSSADLLPDLASNSSVFNIGDFQRIGFQASVKQRLAENLRLGVAVGNSGVLVAGRSSLASNDPAELREMLAEGRRTWLAATASGISPWTGTDLTVSYHWTDYAAVSPRHIYLTQSYQPDLGFNIGIRQPLPSFGVWSGRVVASAELRNLLAQGYVPVSSADGRTLYLIQNPRTVRGGLSFIF